MDKMWYYVVNEKDKAGPVSELELKNFIQQGQVQPTALVWSEGMANWQPANQVPGLIGMGAAPAAAPAAGPAPAGSVSQAAAPAASYATSYSAATGAIPEGLVGWTKFVGVISIIHGILTCLGCITIPLGVLMILAGNAALNSCKALDGMASLDGGTLAYLQNIKKFMLMWGIVAIIGIILTLISIPLYISTVTQLMEQMQAGGGF